MIRIPNIAVKHNWRNTNNSDGLYPVHIRVHLEGEPDRYYPVILPQKVRIDDWSGQDNHWVKPSHPFFFEINCKIAETLKSFNDLVKRFYNHNKAITFHVIEKELMYRGDRNVVNDYFMNYIRKPPETVKLDDCTWEKYIACWKHLNAFQARITFAEVDETLLARFKNYLATKTGGKGALVPATIKSYFDKLKVVLNYAAKKDHYLDPADLEQYFDEVKITVPKKKEGQHLEIDEIQRLRALQFEPHEGALERDRNLFLFQVYTGFYYNDLQILRKDQLFNDVEYGLYIIHERDKNDNPTIIPLYKFPYAASIIERYRDNDPDYPFLFRKKVFIEVQAYNRNLKYLAKKANLVRSISNKTGRHTNAQMWIRFGAERPILSKMLGHEKEQTTQTYYKVGLREVIEGTKGIEFGKMGI